MMNHSDQFDKTPEHLKCPVCMLMPKGKVLQCREGHTLCETCYSQLRDCPQCRLPFGKEPIRNRLAETMLDELNFDCPYKSSGCSEDLDRKSFEDHGKMCHFNFSKFGPLVNVCNAIGISSDCSFRMNRGNVVEAIQHCGNAHMIFILDRSNVNIRIGNFGNPNRSLPPFYIMNQDVKGYAFLLSLKLDTSHGLKHLDWNAFYWRYPSWSDTTTITNDDVDQAVPYTVELSLFGAGKNSLKWNVSPISILELGDPAFSTAFMKVPAYAFVNEDDILNGEIKVLPTSPQPDSPS